MKEVLKRVIFEQHGYVERAFIERVFPDYLINCEEIVIISGIRRCGKSVLLNQIRNANLEKDFHINFDDERLIHFTVEDFQLLHELFIELFGVQKTFYFDEIQNIKGWERFVRRLYDSGNKIYITGSNANLLSKELGTHLTGRYIQYELFPFSFREYLKLTGIEFSEKHLYTTEGRATMSKAFTDFFFEGGFPQFVENKNVEYLKSLYESILYRDVMIRNNLTNEREIVELIYYLAGNVSKLSSFNALSKTIGVKSSTTVKNYVDFIENTYMLFYISKFDFSVRKQIQNPKKFYFIDNAMVSKLGFSFSKNSGRLLENLVYISLRRYGYEIFYHSNKHECDFLIRKNGTIDSAIQVCYNLSEEYTKQREIEGLVEALNIHNLSEGLIITMDEESEIIIENKLIKIVPAWKWMLKSSESHN